MLTDDYGNLCCSELGDSAAPINFATVGWHNNLEFVNLSNKHN